ncbi:putative Xaa-Pro aminopeptidase P [Drechslerella stenobrocha 248]|uniref:Probable Xaa-Pro aminopeptidase P n=1 Tax=Drechslerella stenobrocha 248 TaxID=1043628 RepID=W7HNK4_9PEZI|nr:putative Xaa-Pro aminopeptidase P [Drechslerella stenobrocha 248]
MTDTTGKLSALRELMKKHGVDIYIVPSEDAHQSEYTSPCDGRREFISGFTGSAGWALITHDKAALSTDGRYFNQAAQQLDGNWTLLKQGMPDVPTWSEWVAEQSADGKSVGVDSSLITFASAKSLEKKIQKKGGKGLVAMTENLIDQVWGKDRPSRPSEPVIVLDQKFAGKGFVEKIEDLRKELQKQKSHGLILSGLDEIMWLFNIRGAHPATNLYSNIPFNPVFFCYATVTPTNATLYINPTQVTEELRQHLGSHVEIADYEPILASLTSLSEAAVDENAAEPQKFIFPSNANWALAKALGEKRLEETRSPVTVSKAIKNETELEGMRKCHIRDGVALIEYFAWLEEQLLAGVELDEVDAADKLEAFRQPKENFVGLSFGTISSTGPNAAVIHYHPERPTAAKVDPKAIYLCDSGAQYYDGTTDTTRTLHFGTPTPKEIKAYTLVLKGMVALARTTFPKGISGYQLDPIARQYLWAQGLDYRHGTGHGVGSFLNVHEGPQGIGTRIQLSEVALELGNVLSNEPGYYEDGEFGIRIENIILVVPAKTEYQFGEKPYWGFETVTMVPMCRKLVDVSLLAPDEKTYLDNYHKEVWEKTSPLLQHDERALKWLKRETEPY